MKTLATLACLLASAVTAIAAGPTLTTPIVSGISAVQATFTLRSTHNGTGYFTVLASGASVGTGDQTKAGLDGAGNAAFRAGSLRLAADTYNTYVVRGLAPGTTYTLAFTADDGTTLQPVCATRAFTSAAANDLTAQVWESVGIGGFSPGFARWPSIGFGADGKPYAAFTEAVDTGKIMVMTYGGTGRAWTQVGDLIGENVADEPRLAVSPSGSLLVGFYDPAHVGATVAQYGGGTWSYVGDPNLSDGIVSRPALKVSPSGTPYIAYKDFGTGGDMKLTVRQYAGGTSWPLVGPRGFSVGLTDSYSLAFGPDGSPWIAYQDYGLGRKLVVARYDGAWTAVGGSTAFNDFEAWEISLAFAPDGTPYVAFRGDYTVNYKIRVLQYSGGAWNEVGTSTLPTFDAGYVSLAFAPDGAPCIAVNRYSIGQKVTVVKFDGTAWTAMGPAGFTDNGAGSLSLTFGPDGLPYVSFMDYGRGNRMSVRRLTPPTAPYVTSVTAPPDGLYAAGQALTFRVNFSSPVYVTTDGTNGYNLSLAFKINNASRSADYVSGSGTNSLVFRYTLDSYDKSPIEAPTLLFANTCLIDDSATGVQADLTLHAVEHTKRVIIPVAPTASIVNISNVGANTALLWLQSSANGTGYFTLLPGGSAASGTGAQVKAGQDSAGATAFRFGSMPLEASTNRIYTLRNLPAGSTFTVCFTAEGDILQPTPVTATFTTAAAPDLSTYDWTPVGSVGFSTAGVSDTCLGFSHDGKPNVVYQNGATSGADSYLPALMKWSGTQWVLYGGATFSAASAGAPKLGWAPDGTTYVAYRDTGAGGRATVRKYVVGTGWVTEGSGGFSADSVMYISLALAPDGTPYVAYRDMASSGKATVMRFNGSWGVVGSAGFSAGDTAYTSLAFAPDGTPWIAYSDVAAAKKATVAKFNGTGWVGVGAATLSTGQADDVTVAFAPDGTPHLAFRDSGRGARATVLSFNGTAWVPVGAEGFSAGQAADLSLAFTADGRPGVAYRDYTRNDKAVVMAFDGTNWTPLGTPGFSTADAWYTSLAVGPDGIPHIAYMDGGNASKVAVLKLAATVVKTTPTITWTAPSAITYGTALSGTQLNATATASGSAVAGTFTYTPAAGTVLPAGANQTLSVTFTPTNTTAYNAASASRTITVNRAPATVTLSGLTATYNGSPHPVTVTTTPSGLATSLTYDGGATAPTNAGSYAVSAVVTDANYTGAASGTLVISKLSQTITFAPIGTPEPAAGSLTLSATASSGLPVTFTSSAPSVATVSGNVVTFVGTGTTILTANQAGNATYNAAPAVTQTLTLGVEAPWIYQHPVAVSATEGSTATFQVAASGSGLTYQWKKNGVALGGAQSKTLVLTDLQSTDAGEYSVVVSNAGGIVASNPVTLTVTPRVTPVSITRQPAAQTIPYGGAATLGVVATGTGPLTYQWYRDGVAVRGATASTLTITGATAAQAGQYTVVVTNSAGSVTSQPAVLTVTARGFAGAYFGTFGAAGGPSGIFALYIRADGTGVFLAFETAGGTAFISRELRVDSGGRFNLGVAAANPSSLGSAVHALTAGGAAALPAVLTPTVTVSGTIGDDGAVAGSFSGGSNLTLTAPAPAVTTVLTSGTGYYQAGVSGASAMTHTIVGATGEAFVLTVSGTTADAGVGTVDAQGVLCATTAKQCRVDGSLNAPAATLKLTVTPATGGAAVYTGANNEVRDEVEKLINASTRGEVGSGNALIAGFVLTGPQPKQVLLRAVGPTLAGFGVARPLAAARMELFRGTSSLATAADWGATNATAIANAATRVGAFALPAGSHDSALLVSLEPGNYSVLVNGQGSATGIALVEVYDATEGAIPRSQRLINLSTRGFVGTGDSALIAGVVVTGAVPKRLLIRGVGPSLASYAVSGVLARPQLAVMTGKVVVAQNAGWSTSTDAPAIVTAAAEAGAFTLAAGSADAALLLSLDPGAHTVQLTGVGATTGVALIEVYELP